MKMSQEEREGIARRVELAFKRMGSCIRDRIIAGDTIEEAGKHVAFWMEIIERETAKLER